MNLNNLFNQLRNATNPLAMLTNMLNPSQKQLVNQFQSKPDMEKAEQIVKICNEKGINKEQFQQIVSFLNKK